MPTASSPGIVWQMLLGQSGFFNFNYILQMKAKYIVFLACKYVHLKPLEIQLVLFECVGRFLLILGEELAGINSQLVLTLVM